MSATVAERIKQKQDRIGEIRYTNSGERMKIIEYNNCKDVQVQFDDGTIVNPTYIHFQSGEVKNPNGKTVKGIGYVGVGKYKSHYKGRKIYGVWGNIIGRCYDKKEQLRRPSYVSCSVAPEWHNFQNFSKWYEENYYKVGNERMDIDKDILHKGNKIYSPENCIFVPQRINSLFVRGVSVRGSCLIGVCYIKEKQKYKAACSDCKDHRVFIGEFDSETEAFNEYKKRKESIIKETAERYKDDIPNKLYTAMMNYKVEITD